MAAPTNTPDPAEERAQLAERLMLHLQGSIEAFQRDVLGSIQTEFWATYVREPGATMATLDAVLNHQAQLVTDLCEQMHEVVIRECAPLVAMVTERVPAWAQALQVESERVSLLPEGEELGQGLASDLTVIEPEKTLTPVEPRPEAPVRQMVTELSWHGRWRERHGITVPSRRTYQRRTAYEQRTQGQTRTQEQSRGQRD